MGVAVKTYVYIDAFNLYFGCVKGTPHKWLSTLCAILLPQHQVERIKYFTAHVKSLPNSSGAPARQQLYLRALRTLDNLEIIYGHFLSHPVRMPLAPPRFWPTSNG